MSDRVAAVDNFDSLSSEQRERFIAEVLHYKSEYERGVKEADGISAAATFHNLIDEQVKKGFEVDDGIKASCSKGCSFCCYIHNEITDDETQLLIEYSRELKIEIDLVQLRKQQGKTLEDYKTMKSSDRKCVFLSQAGECKVYEHRPGTCRKYYVASDPSLCDMDNNKSTDVSVIVSTPAEIFFSAAALASKKTGLMADMLIEKLNQNGNKRESIQSI